MRNEEIDLTVQHFGTLFVYNLPEYIKHVAKLPPDKQDELKAIVTSIPIVGGRSPPRSIVEYSRKHSNGDEEAFSWQEALSDDHLLALLKLFRSVASNTV